MLFLLAGCGGSDRARRCGSLGVKYSPAAADRLDAALKDKVEDTGVPGATAAVVFADGREWSGAVGDAVLHPRQADDHGHGDPVRQRHQDRHGVDRDAAGRAGPPSPGRPDPALVAGVAWRP